MPEEVSKSQLFFVLTLQKILISKLYMSESLKKINSFPNDKILAWSKLKAYADDKTGVVKIMISLLDRVENTGGKGENAGNQHFLLFPQCFQKTPF